jgi:hypothetical protein
MWTDPPSIEDPMVNFAWGSVQIQVRSMVVSTSKPTSVAVKVSVVFTTTTVETKTPPVEPQPPIWEPARERNRAAAVRFLMDRLRVQRILSRRSRSG